MRESLTNARLTRRDFLTLAASAVGATTLAGCRVLESKGTSPSGDPPGSRITARPGASTSRQPLAPGLAPLSLDVPQEVLRYVPNGYSPDRPAPLAVALHGAGQSARTGIAPLMAHADALGLILVAP